MPYVPLVPYVLMGLLTGGRAVRPSSPSRTPLALAAPRHKGPGMRGTGSSCVQS
ncbi:MULTISPECIES: hypothetical protein [unclassified Streptomyces]|uniref:hypothetical protein n=1 Tax=unclassified Streptomyces TaxID=2593676 RepID=UPI0036EAC05C